MLQHYKDYAVPLLRLLVELPGGWGTRADVSQQFLERHRDEIPERQFEVIARIGEQRWYVWLDWARDELKKMGLMDASKPGLWRITQAGRDWLAANPSESHVERPRPARSLGREPAERPGATVVPRGITLEMLEQTRQVMSPDQFRQVWGAIYDQIVAEERRKAITPVNDRFLAEKTRVIVQRVQDFLQGRSTESPKSETVCDWIFICYNLELFREGAALWQYVNKDETNPWQYERTMRLSAACRARVSP
jgi:hypothetical protein